MVELGVGPQPIPRPKLSAVGMAGTLCQMSTHDMRAKATKLDSAICAEQEGVDEAVRLIEMLAQP